MAMVESRLGGVTDVYTALERRFAGQLTQNVDEMTAKVPAPPASSRPSQPWHTASLAYALRPFSIFSTPWLNLDCWRC